MSEITIVVDGDKPIKVTVRNSNPLEKLLADVKAMEVTEDEDM